MDLVHFLLKGWMVLTEAEFFQLKKQVILTASFRRSVDKLSKQQECIVYKHQ